MSQWNPEQYLKYANERTQPSIDLAARIRIDTPNSIVDIGCGPGNSTEVLRNHWPRAQITGIDNSLPMIEKATKECPEQKWVLADAAEFNPVEKFDIVFSNATLQWIPSHEVLIPHLYALVNKGGVLAVQVPANADSPLYNAVITVAKTDPWYKYTIGCESLLNYRSAEYYYPILAALKGKFDIWQTTYYHRLSSHQGLIEWYRGTGMKPFLDKLPDPDARKNFETKVLELSTPYFSVQVDGTVLFPFKRTFFTIYK